jgi:sugar lactone lactonase YvrE
MIRVARRVMWGGAAAVAVLAWAWSPVRMKPPVTPAEGRYERQTSPGTGSNAPADAGIRRIKPALSNLTALAVGPGDRIVVAGSGGIEVLDAAGARRVAFAVAGPVRALAVGTNGDIFAGLDRHVEVYSADGRRKAEWVCPQAETMITSVAVSPAAVFVADCRNRTVWRFSHDGVVTGRVGDKEPFRRPEGYVVPSAFFDVATAPDGSLWVANTGLHRLERYDSEGRFLGGWGRPSAEPDGFCGCCNPSHFAVMPDGRFVTSEKHIVRVKVYDRDGGFIRVVSGPGEWPKRTVGLDLAVDSRGRILVLDPAAGGIRVYE